MSGPPPQIPYDLRRAFARFMVLWDCNLYGPIDRALAAGLVTPALVELWQFCGRPVITTAGEIEPIVHAALAELNCPMSIRDAGLLLTGDMAHRIATGQEEPATALEALRDLNFALHDRLPSTGFAHDGCDAGWLSALYWIYAEPSGNYFEPERRVITNEAERRAILDRIARQEAAAWLERHPEYAVWRAATESKP